MMGDISDCTLQKKHLTDVVLMGYRTNKQSNNNLPRGEIRIQNSAILFKMSSTKLKIVRHQKKE